MTLAPPRLLNLFYHRWLDGAAPEGRAAVDAALEGDYSLLAALAAKREAEAPAGRRAGNRPASAAARAPLGKDGRRVPGTAPDNIPPPSWWRGDRNAFRSSVAAGQHLGEAAAMAEPPVPVIGSGALAGQVT